MMDDTKQTIALLGDIMMTRSVSVFREPEYLKMRDMLNAADAVFANFEACAHPYLEDAHQQRLEGGSYATTEPALLKDLKWLGVNMVAAGSGHADDYGGKAYSTRCDTSTRPVSSMRVRAAISRKRARQPTSKFRLGASRLSRQPASSEVGARAGDQRYDTLGYPGVNGFRHKQIYEVDAATLAELREIGKRIGWDTDRERRGNQGRP